MKKTQLWLLAAGLSACGQQVTIAPEVALKQPDVPSFRQQVQVLQAEQVKVSAAPGKARMAVLNLEVLNPHNPAGQSPDTLKQRMRKLARLLVADLASPDRYQVVTAQATFKGGFFAKGSEASNTSSQTFIYPIASLR